MLECLCVQGEELVLLLRGRLDGLGAPTLQKEIDLLIQQGQRTLRLDLSQVNFLSSAGLRILLMAHKKLKAIGGNVMLLAPSAAAQEVLEMSGFEALFRPAPAAEEDPASDERVLNGHRFKGLELPGPAGTLYAWGNPGKLERASYQPQDLQPIPRLDWGLGLAALGRDWSQVKDFFGETVFLDGHAFVYPALPHSAVDFVFREGLAEGVQGLYGWGFSGSPRWILGFKEPMELGELCQTLLGLSNAPALGLVLLGESEGMHGLNLRRSPVEGEGAAFSLFDAEEFPQWMDFPVEAEAVHARVAAVGFVCRKPVPEAWRESLPAQTNFHVHGLICKKGSLSQDPAHFQSELERLLRVTELHRVQHLLGRSCFKSGLVAVTELSMDVQTPCPPE